MSPELANVAAGVCAVQVSNSKITIRGVAAMLAITRELFEHATDRMSIPLTALDLGGQLYIGRFGCAEVSSVYNM